MKTTQHKNFSVEYNTRLSTYQNNGRYAALVNGKIKTEHVKCPKCQRSNYVNNGYHQVKEELILALSLDIKISQFFCLHCNTFWSTERELIDQVIQKHKELVKSILLGCARAGLSFEKASQTVNETIGKTLSAQYTYELYVQIFNNVKQEKFESASGVYIYDEQYLKSNGEDICRLTIKDAGTKKIILDKQTPDAQDETIKHALKEALKELPVEVFIVDMEQRYPHIIKELFPKAKIQWCLFHLHKIIWYDLIKEFGKNIPLEQVYNAYALFNVFFNHEPELKKLEQLLKKHNQLKTGHADSDREIEQQLKKQFGEYVQKLKKERRRNKQQLGRRTLEQSQKNFSKIQYEKDLCTYRLQKRITYMEQHWDKFSLFQKDPRVEPTTNGIEQYFASTLSKTEKKDFRSTQAITRELNACQAEHNGQHLFPTTKLVDVLTLVGMLFLAFPP